MAESLQAKNIYGQLAGTSKRARAAHREESERGQRGPATLGLPPRASVLFVRAQRSGLRAVRAGPRGAQSPRAVRTLIAYKAAQGGGREVGRRGRRRTLVARTGGKDWRR